MNIVCAPRAPLDIRHVFTPETDVATLRHVSCAAFIYDGCAAREPLPRLRIRCHADAYATLRQRALIIVSPMLLYVDDSYAMIRYAPRLRAARAATMPLRRLLFAAIGAPLPRLITTFSLRWPLSCLFVIVSSRPMPHATRRRLLRVDVVDAIVTPFTPLLTYAMICHFFALLILLTAPCRFHYAMPLRHERLR